jgi:hypothetical protein
MKILPVGVELFHADPQMDEETDMTKLVVALDTFANAPKISFCLESWNLSPRVTEVLIAATG